MHLEREHHIATGENVNFIFPIVPRNKKVIAIPEHIAILETNSEAISVPATEESQINETPIESQLPVVSVVEHPLKKKRGRKPKQAGTEKEPKRPKAKKAKEDLTNSNL